jgi:hypothetical protein
MLTTSTLTGEPSSFSACSASRPLRPGRLMSSTSTSQRVPRISVRSSP